VDKEPPITVNTRGKALEDGWHALEVERGGHSFRVRASGGGDVRLYGVVLENDGPGVVWDGMVLIGGSTRGMRTQDAEHIKRQVQHRDLDMIVFLFGGNDMERNHVDLKESMEPYDEEYGEALRKYRAGKPEMSCLVLSMTDRGERTVQGTVVSRKFAKQLSKAQREVARRHGCGFFDTYEAAGGEGSIAKWYRANPPLISPDLGHPSAAGHEAIARLVTHAILHGYQGYRDRMTGKALKPEE
jgi:lysophospholipase L1-like esterase